MDNSISINLNNGNNSMDSLSFHWTAGFKDGSDLMQFNEDGTENRFKLVKDRIEELKDFYIYNKDLSKIFIVNLDKGYISFGKTQTIQPDLLKEEKKNIRLIFFRRHTVELTISNIEKSHVIIYFLGFQYNDKNGYNRKIILIIDNQGNWYLGD
jgi:hypothetical protein